jgi:hypothetical protein
MGTTTALRREIKRRFIPHVEHQGFMLDEHDAPTFWLFRRAAGTSAQIFGIQWEKYGRPRFRLDFGSCPIEGMVLAGQRVDWRNMHPHWLPEVASLRPGQGILSGSWFRQDRALLRRLLGAGALRDPGEVVDELLAAYPEVEAYWENGATGKHIRRWPIR